MPSQPRPRSRPEQPYLTGNRVTLEGRMREPQLPSSPRGEGAPHLGQQEEQEAGHG